MEKLNIVSRSASRVFCSMLTGTCLLLAGCIHEPERPQKSYDYPLKASLEKKLQGLSEEEVRALFGTPYEVRTDILSKNRTLKYKRSSLKDRPTEILQALVVKQGDKRFGYEFKPDRTSQDMATCGVLINFSADGTLLGISAYEAHPGDCEYLGELPLQVERGIL